MLANFEGIGANATPGARFKSTPVKTGGNYEPSGGDIATNTVALAGNDVQGKTSRSPKEAQVRELRDDFVAAEKNTVAPPRTYNRMGKFEAKDGRRDYALDDSQELQDDASGLAAGSAMSLIADETSLGAPGMATTAAIYYNEDPYGDERPYYESEVRSMYWNLLGRAPDPAGLNHWVSYLMSGWSVVDVEYQIMASPEYQNRMQLLHEQQIQLWTQQITDVYVQLLGRTPDAGGLEFYKTAFSNGMTVAQMETQVRASDEYIRLHAVAPVPTPSTASNVGVQLAYFDDYGNAIIQVGAGETMQNLAQQVYGDASLWYVISGANRAMANSELHEGKMIILPNSKDFQQYSSSWTSTRSLNPKAVVFHPGGTAWIGDLTYVGSQGIMYWTEDRQRMDGGGVDTGTIIRDPATGQEWYEGFTPAVSYLDPLVFEPFPSQLVGFAVDGYVTVSETITLYPGDPGYQDAVFNQVGQQLSAGDLLASNDLMLNFNPIRDFVLSPQTMASYEFVGPRPAEPIPIVYVNGTSTYNPNRHSMMFYGYGNDSTYLRKDVYPDGRTVETYSNGYRVIDVNGLEAFTPAFTGTTDLTDAAYDKAAARNSYLASKYDPTSWFDRVVNLITHAMDDPSRVMTAAERTEHEQLSVILSNYVDNAVNVANTSSLIQRLDLISSSPLATAAFLMGNDDDHSLQMMKMAAAGDQILLAKASVRSRPGQTTTPTAIDINKPYSNPNNRPKFAAGQVEATWQAAVRASPDGLVRDLNTGQVLTWNTSTSRAGQWDMGHIPGETYAILHGRYMAGDITLQQFLAEYRNPANYRPEAPGANRSYRYEH